MHPVHPDLVLQRVAHGFPVGGDSPDECGPCGILFGPAGELIVANGGTGDLFRVPGAGGKVATPLATGCGVFDLAVGPTGVVFGTRPCELVELDIEAGTVTRTVATGFGELVGLIAEPDSGLLVAADFASAIIYEVEPATGDKRVRASGPPLQHPNGIAGEGGHGDVYVADYGNSHVIAVHRDGAVEDLGHFPGRPDGVALGAAGSPLAGSVIVSQRDGTVVASDSHGHVATLAEGGTPCDLLAVDAKGHLYVTQSDEILRVAPPWFAPQPWRDLSRR